MESSRLPGKALLDLAGKPLLYHVIDRTLHIKNISKVILATSESNENYKLADLAQTMGVETFFGSALNVLERFYEAHKAYGGEYIMRITGDNPFVDPEYASMALDMAIESDSDLCSIINLPLGVAVEIIKQEALIKSYKESTESHHLEHVTPYIKENENLFRINRGIIMYDNYFPDLRLTVDEQDDYTVAKTVYENLYHGAIFSLQNTIDFFRNNPSLLLINKNIRQKPMTESAIK